MKKYFCSVYIFLFLIHLACAQNKQYGLRFGLGFSDNYQLLKGSPFSKEVRKKLNEVVYPIFSWGGNLFYNIPVHKTWHISISPGLMQKGYKLSSELISGKINFRYYYFQLPIGIHYTIAKRLNIGVGPEIGYNFRNAVSPVLAGSHVPVIREKLEYSGFVSVGYKILSAIDMSFKMNMDFIAPETFDITDPNGNYAGQFGLFNRYVIFSIGYKL